MADQEDDRVLTYRGFALRKSGKVEEGMAYYQAAIAKNPDNFLVNLVAGLVAYGFKDKKPSVKI